MTDRDDKIEAEDAKLFRALALLAAAQTLGNLASPRQLQERADILLRYIEHGEQLPNMNRGPFGGVTS